MINAIALNNEQYLVLFCKDVSYAHFDSIDNTQKNNDK